MRGSYVCIRKTFLLLAVALTAPVAIAQVSPVAVKPLAFDVATIKPSQAAGWNLHPTLDGYTGVGISLRQLVQAAYGFYDDKLFSGGPAWIDSDKFDLEAKFNTSEIAGWNKLTFRQRSDMLQPLLAERFHLKVHHETRSFPVYSLVVAKSGSKLQPTRAEASDDLGIGVTCRVLQSRPGYVKYQSCMVGSMSDLLRWETGRSVIDRSGLTNHYDFELRWTPDSASTTAAGDESGPSIFTAIQEQLGLRLEPATAALEILVIDHAELPSEN